MDSALTELDDWVGTLEELQLGLERKCPSAASCRLATRSPYSGSQHPNRKTPTPPSPWRVPQIQENPLRLPPRREIPMAPTNFTHIQPAVPPRTRCDDLSPCSREHCPTTTSLIKSIRASFNPPPPPHTCKDHSDEEGHLTNLQYESETLEDRFLTLREANAENDLNSLLRQLEEVEYTMQQLEEDDGFTRRYSLASSSTTDPNTGCNSSPAPDAPEQGYGPTVSGLDPLTKSTSDCLRLQDASSPEQQGTLHAQLKPALPPRKYYRRPSLPQNSECKLNDEPRMEGAVLGESVLNGPPETTTAVLMSPSSTATQTNRLHFNDRVLPHERERYQSSEADQNPNMVHQESTVGADSNSSPLKISFPPSSALTQSDIPPQYRPRNGSVSDKSVAECGDLSEKIKQVVNLADRLHLNKLVVRIFRPDKTTKAILIDRHMTAGEVASMLMEKNFLQPSINLCLVEKVPSLKVERVFEESERVAECILAWPTKSQNMIFFESREEHFGFIESPKDWLGDSFASMPEFNSNNAACVIMDNLASSGLAEWQDILYIRKPGEKTWTRRMCVLRNSGLYATRKNKKTFSVSDLIRILVLDEKLHIYMTTGGWTRMRAPTPHGFALKTYAAQELSSTHVFCFCATDENALKRWICRLRLAKLGSSLFQDYQTARARVNELRVSGQNSDTLARKSSFECVRPTMDPGFQTPQLLTRRQVSAGNLCMEEHPSATPPTNQHRIAALTTQPTPPTLLRTQHKLASHLQNGCFKNSTTSAK